AHVVPVFPDTPYPTQPSRLYTADDLAAGFAEGGFESMYDTRVFRHYVERGGATPHLREALPPRGPDPGVDNAPAHPSGAWVQEHGAGGIVGVMGGHAERRGSPAYRAAAALSWQLSRAGKLILTGGGPGVMEAANLGSYLSTLPEDALSSAIDDLALAPD